MTCESKFFKRVSANSEQKIFIKRSCGILGKYFKISVKDYGTGIEKEEIDKIFNKYYSGKLNLTRSSTGLGLYLSNKIIKALGGKIEVQSKKNEGSAFTVTLPVE